MLQRLCAAVRENTLGVLLGVLEESGTNGRARRTAWIGAALLIATGGPVNAARAPRPGTEPELAAQPSLIWSTFLGGVGTDAIEAVDVDTSGAITVAGWTGGYNFPVTAGALQTTPSADYQDAFVARFDAGGQLLWCTLLGGTDGDTRGLAMVVARGGEVWIAGDTLATDFPTTAGAWQTVHAGNSVADAFVARLSADGGTLLAATLFGGAGDDGVRALVLRPGQAGPASAGVVAAGWSRSLDIFGTSKASSTGGSPPADSRAFVVGFDSGLSAIDLELVLDGSQDEEVTGLALGADGTLALVGQTLSPDFPTTTGAWQATPRGDWDCFAAVIDGTGAVQAVTYIGGSLQEFVPAVALGPGGDLWVTGGTSSPDFPTTPGAADTVFDGGAKLPFDGFVLRLPARLDRPAWSTLLGGNGLDLPTGIWVDSAGRATVVGDTGSSDFPVTPGAMDTTFNGGDPNFPTDAFVARVSAAGDAFPYGTYMGGGLGDGARDLYCYGPTSLVIAGTSQSADLPVTPGAFQTEHGGPGAAPFDGFIARLELGPAADLTAVSTSEGAPALVQGSGAEPGAVGIVIVTFEGSPVQVRSVLADENGAFALPAPGEPWSDRWQSEPANVLGALLLWRSATGDWTPGVAIVANAQ